MLNLKSIIKPALLLALCFSFAKCFSQDADSLFTTARDAAFKNKDLKLAKKLSQEALAQSPDNHDIRIFLGRIYSWTGEPDSARKYFLSVLQKEPQNTEASLAYATLEYWNGDDDASLKIINEGLRFQPGSEELLMLQAKVLNRQRNYEEANVAVSKVLNINSGNSEARALGAVIRQNRSKHTVSLNYSFVTFDKEFGDPWQLSALEYSRSTKAGAFSGRMNYARRFNRDGFELEADAYPKITEKSYAYITTGYSSAEGIFPKFKMGVSLFRMLPANFEAEVGFRRLKFDTSNQIYVASIGKYTGKFWLNFRSCITSSGYSSQSYFLSSRYYLDGTEDYISLGLGTGVSPDDASRNLLLAMNDHRLNSYNVSLIFKKSFRKMNTITFNTGWIAQELKTGINNNQFELGLGFQRRF